MSKKPNSHAVVIGAGVAGLAAAIRLACKGFSVEVFEKNSYPGGKLSYFEQDGYGFDAGPSLFTQPWLIDDLFALAGKKREDYITWERAQTTCTYFFANGKVLQADKDSELFAAEAERVLGEPAEHVKTYLSRASALYANTADMFLNHSLHKASTYLGRPLVKALTHARPAYLFQSLDAYNKSCFSTPEMVQLFNRYATYNGSNPYAAPGMLSVIPHLEMNEGTYYPHGGMISITNALHALAVDLGVRFHFNHQVERILHNGKTAEALQVNGMRVDAEVFVSNSDVYFVKKLLLQDEAAAQRVLKQERSSSAFIFYWGIRHWFKQLGLHNIFFSNDYAAEFDHIFHKGTLYEDPTVYVNITAKMEAGMAPEGCENWFVMVNVPANRGQDWEGWRMKLKDLVIKKISRALGVDIAPLIATEAILDPSGIEVKTASYMGSLYGTSSNNRMAAFLRHPNFSTQFSNLYFTGGSVHPGGGIPLCLRSAAIVSGMVAPADSHSGVTMPYDHASTSEN